MTKSVKIDAGHGGSDSGAIGFGVLEKDWTLKMSLYQFKRLKELGAKVGMTRTNDKTLSPNERTNLIKNKYDYCISNHFNAFNGKARGIETIHSIFGSNSFAKSIANELVKTTGLPLRRVFNMKGNNGLDYYFMHRMTGSTETIIVEYGFIDNKADHDWYKNENNFYKAGEAVIKAICKEIGISYKSPGGSDPVKKPSKGFYKVQTGAFSKKSNAENLAKKLKKDGYDTFIVYDKYYKVQTGAFNEKSNADSLARKLKKDGYETFIVY